MRRNFFEIFQNWITFFLNLHFDNYNRCVISLSLSLFSCRSNTIYRRSEDHPLSYDNREEERCWQHSSAHCLRFLRRTPQHPRLRRFFPTSFPLFDSTTIPPPRPRRQSQRSSSPLTIPLSEQKCSNRLLHRAAGLLGPAHRATGPPSQPLRVASFRNAIFRGHLRTGATRGPESRAHRGICQLCEDLVACATRGANRGEDVNTRGERVDGQPSPIRGHRGSGGNRVASASRDPTLRDRGVENQIGTRDPYPESDPAGEAILEHILPACHDVSAQLSTPVLDLELDLDDAAHQF